jgi:hypothetical protein
MDKSKFTSQPHLDSEGFPRTNEDIDSEINRLLDEHGLLEAVQRQQAALAEMERWTTTMMLAFMRPENMGQA